jgi:hypothetical protein
MGGDCVKHCHVARCGGAHLGRLRLENHEFKASVGMIATHSMFSHGVGAGVTLGICKDKEE